MIRSALIWSVLVLLAAPSLGAEGEQNIKHRIMFFEYGADAPNRLVELDTDGKIVWEHKPLSLAVIFQPLADGHVLYAYGGNPTGVVEIDRDQKPVWNFVSKCPQVLGCQRLPNGNTLVAEQGPPAAVEVDPQGKIVHTTPLVTSYGPYHQQVRNVQQELCQMAISWPGTKGKGRHAKSIHPVRWFGNTKV